MSNSEATESAPKLKIWGLVKETYGTLFRDFMGFVQTIWLLVGLNVAFAIYQLTAGQEVMLKQMAEVQTSQDPAAFMSTFFTVFSIGIIITFVFMFLMGCVGVAVYRLVLLREKPSIIGFRIGRREVRTFGYLLAFMVLGFLLMLPVMIGMALLGGLFNAIASDTGAMSGVFHFAMMFIVFSLMIMISIRTVFVLPALAMDQQGGLWRRIGAAWRSARGNTFRMFLALVVSQLPIIFLNFVMMTVFAITGLQTIKKAVESGGDPNMMMETVGATEIIMGILMWLSMLLFWIMFAIAYRKLTAHDGDILQQPAEA